MFGRSGSMNNTAPSGTAPAIRSFGFGLVRTTILTSSLVEMSGRWIAISEIGHESNSSRGREAQGVV